VTEPRDVIDLAEVPIRAAIVDDEPPARAMLRQLLAQDAAFSLVGEASDVAGAVRVLRGARPDLALLDVRLPSGTGFDILHQLGQLDRPREVVFITAWDEHAVAAFEAQALDYILKPFEDSRFLATLERVKRRVREGRLAQLAPGPSPGGIERLAVKSLGKTRIVEAAEIDWIEGADYYVRLHVGGKSYLLREPLHELEKRLDPARFVRIHRSTIVQLGRLAEIRPASKGDAIVVLKDGTHLRASRTHRRRLASALQ
jgi:two-component system, LytTR family, response regulator